MKVCNKCKEEKPFSFFSVDKRSKGGYQTRCKPCQAKVKKQMKDYYRSKHLEYKFKMALEDYDRMLDEQKGKCSICSVDEKDTELGRFCVDHDHKTGKVRALLCKKCNQAIGLLQDNAENCLSAFRYLTEHSK